MSVIKKGIQIGSMKAYRCDRNRSTGVKYETAQAAQDAREVIARGAGRFSFYARTPYTRIPKQFQLSDTGRIRM